MTLDASTRGDLPNVRFLAKACELAYLDEPEGAAGFHAGLGLDARLFSVDNTQVYVASDPGALVIAFRGSQSPTSLDGLKDWLLTNANNLLVVPEGRIGTDFAAAGVGARFHRGFMQALDEIWAPLVQAVHEDMDASERPLWVTGHSLGGAIALLAAWRFQRAFIPVNEVVTFGAPMIGNAVAAHAFERAFPGRILRYVDIEDPVPLLPTVSLVANAYAHCLKEVRLQGPEPRAFVHSLGELGSRAVAGMLTASLADELWTLVRRGIDAHLIPNYQERLRG
ncbi:lipase family protein [Thiocapsa bogorovii]|uniref:lipase family protein n=1 Tax=Thiocapsa bogorovii TaxID=521689 RepID=UPI001E435CCA|nr:lipase family protein [Thiocapsa bogorovii]UHD17685.1 lipase family protein [Thiocapsa bogorovii]